MVYLNSLGVRDLCWRMERILSVSSFRLFLAVDQLRVGDSQAPRYRRALWGEVTDECWVVIDPSGCRTVMGADL